MRIWLEEWTTAELPTIRLSEAGRRAARAINGSGCVEIAELRDGLRIRAASYVGAFSLDGVEVLIQPKIAPDLVPTFMRYALGLDAIRLFPRTGAPVGPGGFVDVVALLFLWEVDDLIRRGLLQDYRQAEGDLATPRGSILFSQLARALPTSRVELPCRYFSRTPALRLNQVLVGALAALRAGVADPGLRRDLHARECLLQDACGRAALTRATLDEAHRSIDRRSSYYEPVLSFVELILAAVAPTLVDSAEGSAAAFLFDMNLLFERLLARLCVEFAPPAIAVTPQGSLRSAFRYSANPYRWSVPSLRPDLIARDRRTRDPILILDSKYKRLAGQRPDAADLYQLTLYSMGFGRAVPARIVYPHTGPDARVPCLEFVGFEATATLASVSTAALDLNGCARALRDENRSALRAIVSGLLAAGPEIRRKAS